MAETGKLMAGLTLRSLKRHVSLVPLLISLAGGSALAAGYLLRLATKNPDVAWDKKNNPYPWQKYENKQYKLYNVKIDYSKLKHPEERPDI